MTNNAHEYDIAAIRQLLLAAFTQQELRRACLDSDALRSVVDDFGVKYSLNEMVDEIIDYCRRRCLFDELLAGVERVNPRQYARFAPLLGQRVPTGQEDLATPLQHDSSESLAEQPVTTPAVSSATSDNLSRTTALEQALKEAADHLDAAEKLETDNIEACVEYLRAAKSLITGLENEVDEILDDTRQVAWFSWDSSKIAALAGRIDSYLNRERLRPRLDDAIIGFKSCHELVERDLEAFFQRQEKPETAAKVQELLGDLSGYLGSLSSLDWKEYAGPSGVNVEELRDIQKLLQSQPESKDDQKLKKQLREAVENAQSIRLREGFPIARLCSGIIQELMAVLRFERHGDG